MLTLKINNLKVTLTGNCPDRICYILYPLDILDRWMIEAAKRFAVSIAVVTQIDWDNQLTPWKATGIPAGTPDFAGEASRFLTLLQESVIPQVERQLNMSSEVERTLAGVSLSGLFTLWQWLKCDGFTNIMSLSGSFWYDGFVDWVKAQSIPAKKGRAYFLLGDKESQSRVPQFRKILTDTTEIVDFLSSKGINDYFEIVPGNHYQYGEQRLDRAFSWIYVNPGTATI